MKVARLFPLAVTLSLAVIVALAASASAQCTPDVPTGSIVCAVPPGAAMSPAPRADDAAGFEIAMRYPVALVLSRWFSSSPFHTAGLENSAVRERRVAATSRRNPWGLRVRTP